MVDAEVFQKLKAQFPDIVAYPISESSVKLAAGWLIDQSGLKGYRRGDAGVHQQQALVMVNHGQATGEEILELAGHVKDTVNEKFGVALEPEVWIIGEQHVFEASR